jgi:hypothetical protein
MSCAVIRAICIFPKKGIRKALRRYFFVRCSEYLLFGITYSSNHCFANRSNPCSRSVACGLRSIGSPRANLCRRVASYARAPAREFSGLRFLYRVLFAAKSTHHDFFISRTAIHHLVLADWVRPSLLQGRHDIHSIEADAPTHFETRGAVLLLQALNTRGGYL